MARSSGRGRTTDSDDSSRPWKQRCKELLSLVWNQSDAYHFRHPVNLVEYPDYDQVIDTPMSLQAIREDLTGDNYSTPMDFHKDMSLIFENSKNYNTDPRSQIRLMTIRLKSFYEEKYRRILEDWKRNKRRRNVKRGSDSLRTPTKSSLRNSARPLRTRSNLPGNSSPAKPSTSSPRRPAAASSLPLRSGSSSANLQNGTSPRKYPQREAAARNPFVRSRSRFSDRKVSQLRKTARITKRPPRKKISVKNLRRKKPKSRSNGSAMNERNRRASSNVSISAGSTSSHDPIPTSTSRMLRKRRRISSGESAEAGPTTLTNGRSPPHVNGRSPRSKVFIKDESDEHNEGRYNFRNKGSRSSPGESSSPERNTGHNLRARTKMNRIIEYDTDEDEIELEPPSRGPTDDEEEKENTRVPKRVVKDDDEADEEEGSGDDADDGPASVPNDDEDEDDEEDIEMPVLNKERDEDYVEEESEDDNGSEFEGEESPPTSKESSLRRSARARVSKKLFVDSGDEASDYGEGRRAPRASGNKRVTRNRGRSAQNYAENDESDLGKASAPYL